MTQRPSSHLDWNLNAAGGSEVAPTTAEQNDGYTVGQVLRRQVYNFKSRLQSLWNRYLEERIARPGDLIEDGALPGYGSAPTSGAGLTVAAGSFSARIVYEGIGIGPIDGPAYTYTADADTYWDLDRDGTWTAVVVSAGDPEPAVTTNATRVYVVTTNTTDRTAVVDRRDASRRLKQGTTTSTDGIGFGSTGSRQRVAWSNQTSGTHRNRIIYQNGASPLADGTRAALEIAVNAVWQAGLSIWTQTDTTQDSWLYVFSNSGMRALRRASGSSSGWSDNTTAWGIIADFSATDLSTVGTVTASGHVTSVNGGFTGEDVTATVGNIEADIGDIIATLGNVVATAGGVYALAGPVRGQQVGFNSAQTRQLTIPAIAGRSTLYTYDTSTGWAVQSGYIVSTYVAATTTSLMFDLSGLPDGAIITGASIVGRAGSAGTTRAQIVRIDTTGSSSSLHTATYDEFNDIDFPGPLTLNPDVSAAARTVNHALYSYLLIVTHLSGQNATEVSSVSITYTLQNL